jgi:hypothetical protein
MTEVEVGKVVGEGAPEAPIFEYLGAHLGAADLLLEKTINDLTTEIMSENKLSQYAKAEASTILGEIANAFEAVLFFIQRAKSFGLDDFKLEDYIADLLRTIRDLAEVYHNLKNGFDISDIIYSLRGTKMRLAGAYDVILDSLIQKVRIIKVTSENKP